MNARSVSKIETAVCYSLLTVVLAFSGFVHAETEAEKGGGFNAASVDAAIKYRCGSKTGPELEECRQEVIDQFFGAKTKGEQCDAAQEKFNEAQDKFNEACKEAGLAYPSCYKKAQMCADDLNNDPGEFGDEDIVAGAVDCDDIMGGYTNCPVAAAAMVDLLKDKEKDLKDDKKTADERVRDLKKDFQDMQEKQIKDAQLLEEQKEGLRRQEQEAINRLNDEMIKLNMRRTERFAAARKAYIEADAKKLQIEDQIRRQELAVQSSVRKEKIRCEQYANKTFAQMSAQRDMNKRHVAEAGQSNISGAKNRFKKNLRALKDECINSEESRMTVAEKIDELKSLQQSSMKAAMLVDQERNNVMQALQDADMQDEIMKNEMTRRTQEQVMELRNQVNRLMMQHQQLQIVQAQRLVQLQEDMRKADEESKRATADFKANRFRLECAREKAKGKTAPKEGDVASNFSAAVNEFEKLKNVCKTVEYKCKRATNFQPASDTIANKDAGSDTPASCKSMISEAEKWEPKTKSTKSTGFTRTPASSSSRNSKK